MVEFTVTAPLLVALGLGVGEFGRALQHHHVVNKAMRDASRFLARVPVTCAGPGTGSVTDTADLTLARNLALYGQTSVGTPRISYWTNANSVAVTVGCLDNSSNAYRSTYDPAIATVIPLITVTATVPYQDLGFLSALGLGAITFSARHQQVHIGE